MFDLTGKRALVTGASRGTGFGIAKTFAAAGAEIVGTGRNEERLEKLRLEIEGAGGKASVISGDLSTRAGAREVAQKCGDVDILVNNAANTTGQYAGLLSLKDEEWDYEFALNVVGPVTLMQALMPGMVKRRNGVVINISSIAPQQPEPVHVPYAASKSALEIASRAAAIEVASKGVRVNIVALGLTDTEAMQEVLVEGVTADQVAQLFIPIGRVNKVSEVAAACLFLASDEAAAITGQRLSIDGGTTAGLFNPSVDATVGTGGTHEGS